MKRSRWATLYLGGPFVTALASIAACGGGGSSAGVDGGAGEGGTHVQVASDAGGGGATGQDASLPDTGPTGPAGDTGSDGAATDGSGDGGDPLAAARAQCVQIINQDRASLTPPSPPLTEGTAEEAACVDGQAEADFTANTPHSAFGTCNEFAQDECPDWPGPPSSIMTHCLAQMWAEGPPPAGQDNHWLNMSNAKYTKVACGFYQTPSGSWWATQDFWP
jgi:hypothetical protein